MSGFSGGEKGWLEHMAWDGRALAQLSIGSQAMGFIVYLVFRTEIPDTEPDTTGEFLGREASAPGLACD